jgi:hypothetical protein
MKLFYYVCITFALAFAAQYWIISYITSRNPQNSRGKFYLSAFFASMMGILEVMIYDSYRDSVSLFYYVGLGLLAYGMIFAYNTQMGVADDDYLKQMLEHQSRDILLADRIIKNTESQSVRTIATNILNRRKRDVDMMTKMLADLTVGPITGKKLFTKETYAV